MRGLDDEVINLRKSAESAPALSVAEGSSACEKIADITLIPNPTSGELRIENGELRIEKVEVFDVYGRIHSSLVTRHASLITINISHLPAGLYFVKIYTEAGMVVRKVVKQ